MQISDWQRPRSNADRRNLGEDTIPTRELIVALERTRYSSSHVLETFSEESSPDSLWAGDIAANLCRNGYAFATLAEEVLV
jgi:hypothetical protein